MYGQGNDALQHAASGKKNHPRLTSACCIELFCIIVGISGHFYSNTIWSKLFPIMNNLLDLTAPNA